MTPRPAPFEKAGDKPTCEPPQDRTAGLQRAAQARTVRAEKAADAAIRDLVKRGGTINFTAVARVAGVTPAFLHRHPELSARIRELGRAQADAVRDLEVASTTGESAVIGALRRKLKDQEAAHAAQVRELRAKIREMEHQVAELYGRLD